MRIITDVICLDWVYPKILKRSMKSLYVYSMSTHNDNTEL